MVEGTFCGCFICGCFIPQHWKLQNWGLGFNGLTWSRSQLHQKTNSGECASWAVIKPDTLKHLKIHLEKWTLQLHEMITVTIWTLLALTQGRTPSSLFLRIYKWIPSYSFTSLPEELFLPQGGNRSSCPDFRSLWLIWEELELVLYSHQHPTWYPSGTRNKSHIFTSSLWI